ncbi:hypothetical protein RHMOL_Rhmol03G0118100 [Rhododendron molle]|uniref:Uncharacterized protein n=2 Tax=Rhododendron molle TaxID=49168 RepID=A0ACC0PEU2_RHOML|nr:hypothetical protein RHMOL_Rhmol03G0118100 [Rhododendron molle]KAI8563537.1 hypothetical protein RHMOL_Rhmol03G0118100 [Rhododendron molle]
MRCCRSSDLSLSLSVSPLRLSILNVSPTLSDCPFSTSLSPSLRLSQTELVEQQEENRSNLRFVWVVFDKMLDPYGVTQVMYDILVQAGRVVDLYIPRDKETNRPKGFPFAEYETEEIAVYAVGLFSGL